MTWLDDQFLVSGSRDGSLALWRITDDIVDQVLVSCFKCFAQDLTAANSKFNKRSVA